VGNFVEIKNAQIGHGSKVNHLTYCGDATAGRDGNVGAGATIGAGSTITRDAPAETLTLARAKQASIPGWQRPIKKKR
jgi:bifunctional UDP-N-acetylglucosamine pyrophosphorylase/glucosamine-1-phosphate N-acetyltransferase